MAQRPLLVGDRLRQSPQHSTSSVYLPQLQRMSRAAGLERTPIPEAQGQSLREPVPRAL